MQRQVRIILDVQGTRFSYPTDSLSMLSYLLAMVLFLHLLPSLRSQTVHPLYRHRLPLLPWLHPLSLFTHVYLINAIIHVWIAHILTSILLVFSPSFCLRIRSRNRLESRDHPTFDVPFLLSVTPPFMVNHRAILAVPHQLQRLHLLPRLMLGLTRPYLSPASHLLRDPSMTWRRRGK